jgi:cyclic beta-1,2-glucan synthetase
MLLADWIDWLIPADAAISAAAASPLPIGQSSGGLIGNTGCGSPPSFPCFAITLLGSCLNTNHFAMCPLLDLFGKRKHSPIESAAAFSEALEARLGQTSDTLAKDSPLLVLCEQLRASLPESTRNLHALAAGLHAIAFQAENLAEETEFSFLVNPDRRMLSVGYDVTEQKLHPACYDMLASEARLATFLTIARGDLPQQSWLNLGRSHTRAFSRFLLLSWTGTMFEYLMPALWMRSYPDTLIARTLTACVQVQRAFAASLNIPWGISESGFARKDDAGHYQYHAFGIPQAALKFDANAGPTVSPYSTFLALNVDSPRGHP